MLLERVLNETFAWGDLTIVDHRGRRFRFIGLPGRKATIHLHDRLLPLKIVLDPSLAVGEAYVDGTLTIEEGELSDFLAIGAANMDRIDRHWSRRLRVAVDMAARGLRQYNPLSRSRRNVAHHYDLSDELFDLFLDADRQYSCAYFTSPGDTLERAQLAKKRHISAKLLLEPGMRVLDIGSGWGGLAIYLAQTSEVDVTGITLSERQFEVATERAKSAGVADRVRFRLCDYREVNEQFDRVVSVGMFEHVGIRHYEEYFESCRSLLADSGVALVHTIGRAFGPAATSAWIRRYIFPGGYSPALSEVVPVVERCGLHLTDIEILRLHYAETLKAWRERFLAHRREAAALYDERFCRIWDFYLAASEAVFRYGDHVVFQLQFSRRRDAVPTTRDYILAWERKAGGFEKVRAA